MSEKNPEFQSVFEQYADAAASIFSLGASNSALLARAKAGAVRSGLVPGAPTDEALAALIKIASFQISGYATGTPIPPTVRRRLETLAAGGRF